MTLRQQLESFMGKKLTDTQYNKAMEIAKQRVIKYDQITTKDQLLSIAQVCSEVIINVK